MSGNIPFDPSDCDFAVIHHANGMHRIEKWKMRGRLRDALEGVVLDMLDGKYDEGLDRVEFALGFIAAIDVLASGKLRLKKARDRSELTAAIERSYAVMHGQKASPYATTVMTTACERMLKRLRSSGGDA